MDHRDEITEIRDNIVSAFVENAVFDGLDWNAVEAASVQTGHEKIMARAVFPDGLSGALAHFSDMTDRQMLAALEKYDVQDMRVRDRITAAVRVRLEILVPYKEAVKLATAYWNVPPRHVEAGKLVWRTADRIWNWAGDTATDYNRYTKRALLSGVLGSTMMAWLGDEGRENGDGLEIPFAFLDRRIENVMQFGRIIGRIKR